MRHWHFFLRKHGVFGAQRLEAQVQCLEAVLARRTIQHGAGGGVEEVRFFEQPLQREVILQVGGFGLVV